MKKIFALALACVITAATFTACTSNKSPSSVVSMPNSSMGSSVVSSVESSINSPAPTITPSPEASNPESLNMTGKIEDYAMAVKTAYDKDYIPDRVLTETEIQEKIGLKPEMYDEVYCEASTLDENPDVFVAVKVKDDKKTEVEKVLNDYKNKLATDTAFAANTDKIKSGEVHVQGDHVFLFILGANEFMDAGEDLASNFAAETKKGVDAIKNMFK